MKILVITTACDKNRDCQAHLYEYWASKPDIEVEVIAPQYADITKGATKALAYEEQGQLKIHRIYRDIPEMWSEPQSHIKDVERITNHLKPDIIWCWHQRNYWLAKYVKEQSGGEIVLFLEIPEDWIMKLAYQDKVPFILSCQLSDKYREVELTRDNSYFLKMEVPVDVPNQKNYSFERLNRGIFCGSLGYPYKGAEIFVKVLPRLFEETPMERFLLISSGSPIPRQIMEQYGNKYQIDYIESIPRYELFKEIAQSYFSLTTTIVESPGSFPIESWALKTPVFAAACSLGETIIDLKSGVRSIESLKRIYEDRTLYESIQKEAFRRFKEEFSAQSVGRRCYKIFQAILDGKKGEAWEELRYIGGQGRVKNKSLLTSLPQRKLRIGLQLPVINTFNGAVWGDEVMALGLADALSKLPMVEFAEVYDPVTIHDHLDIVINFYPFPEVRLVAGPAQFWWYQAAISPWLRSHSDFTKLLSNYKGFLVASPNLGAELMELGVLPEKIMFLPMSANSRFYRPVPPQVKFAHQIVFCGNNHPGRSRDTIDRYLLPVRDLGLVIYGNGWDEIPELEGCCRGPIHPNEVPTLYSSTKIVLSTHPQWHRLMDVPTSRLWEAAACNSLIISDKLPLARQLFRDTIVWTDGWDDLREKVCYYLEHEKERKLIAQKGYQLILSQYTFDHWAPKVLEFIQQRLQEEKRIYPVIKKSCSLDRPLVSIIVPTYNRPMMLEEAIKSLLNQTYRNLEILIVNDGGEGIEKLIDSLDKDHKITYIKHSRNLERSAARNTALKLARGDYVAYLDDDDIFYPNHLEILVNFLESSTYRVAYTDAYQAIQQREKDTYVTIKKDVLYSFDFDREALLIDNYIPLLCIMHERSLLKEVGLFDESLNVLEDLDLLIRLAQKYDFGHIKELTCEFRMRTDYTNTTSARKKDFLEAHKYIYQKYAGLTQGRVDIRQRQQRVLEILEKEISQNQRDEVPDTVINLKHNEIEYSGQHRIQKLFPPKKLSVSIILVTYNSINEIKPCLESISQYTKNPYEVIIIDNASKDGTSEYLQTLTDIKLILNQENKGFARACNQGIKKASGEYIVLLNPDTIVTRDWDSRLMAHLQAGVGAVGPISNYVAGLQRCDLYLKEELRGKKDIDGLAARFYQWNRGQAIETKLLIGFCLMLKRKVLDRVGLLDEDLYLGNEDLEYSLRIRQNGYKLMVATDTFIYHKGQASFQSEPQAYTQKLVQESTDILFEKLKKIYKNGRVPASQEIWGIDWFKPSPSLLNHTSTNIVLNTAGKSHRAGYRSRTTEYESRSQDHNKTLTSIVILTYNQLEYTKQCLASIEKYTPEPYELILVDNGSTDGTVEYLKTFTGDLLSNTQYKLICNRENLGFAKGCNQGMEQAVGDYILLLNNDVIVTEGWLRKMLSRFEHDSAIGIVGPCSNHVSGAQLDLGAKYSTIEEMQEYARRFSDQNRGRILEVPRLVGFCLLIKHEVLDRIGLLDESFGSGNFEDDDFCLRTLEAGYKCLIAQEVFIHHFGERSFTGNNIDYWGHYERNLRLFVQKWGLKDPDKRKYLVKLGVLPQIYANYYNDLGERYFNEGKPEKAKELFSEAIKIDDNYFRSYNNLGVIAWQEGNKEKALRLFLQAYNLDSKDNSILANLIACGFEPKPIPALLAPPARSRDFG
jgi:GT2 family glycosyltransferase/glycosyltransferase involved in cell wall biosynthesis